MTAPSASPTRNQIALGIRSAAGLIKAAAANPSAMALAHNRGGWPSIPGQSPIAAKSAAKTRPNLRSDAISISCIRWAASIIKVRNGQAFEPCMARHHAEIMAAGIAGVRARRAPGARDGAPEVKPTADGRFERASERIATPMVSLRRALEDVKA